MYLYSSMLKQEIEATIVNATKKTKKIIKDHPVITKVALIGGAIAFRYYYQKVFFKPDPSKFEVLQKILTKIAGSDSNSNLPSWISTSLNIVSLFVIGVGVRMINAKNRQLEENEHQKRNMQEELNSLKSNAPSTSGDPIVNALKEELRETKEELEAAQREIDNLKFGVLNRPMPPVSVGSDSDTESGTSELVSDNKEKEKRIQELENHVNSLNEKIQEVSRELEEKEKELISSRTASKIRLDNNSELQSKLAASESFVKDLREELSASNEKQFETQRRIICLESELGKKNKEIRDYITSKEETDKTRDDALQAAKKKAGELSDEIEKMKREIRTVIEENERLKLDIAQLTETEQQITKERRDLLERIGIFSEIDLRQSHEKLSVEGALGILDRVFHFNNLMKGFEDRLIELKDLFKDVFGDCDLDQFLNKLRQMAEAPRPPSPADLDGDETPSSTGSFSPRGALSRPRGLHERAFTMGDLNRFE